MKLGCTQIKNRWWTIVKKEEMNTVHIYTGWNMDENVTFSDFNNSALFY